MEDLRHVITEAQGIALDPEDVALSKEQQDALNDVNSALKKLSKHNSKMGGLDVRDVKNSLNDARKRLERNVAYVARMSKVT